MRDLKYSMDYNESSILKTAQIHSLGPSTLDLVQLLLISIETCFFEIRNHWNYHLKNHLNRIESNFKVTSKQFRCSILKFNIMFLEMYLEIIATIIVDFETSKSLAKQAHLLTSSFAQSSILFVESAL